MSRYHYNQIVRDHLKIVAAIKVNAARGYALAKGCRLRDRRPIQKELLLRMTEGLISAHKAAKVDDDGLTLDLIEDALRHVGKRLADETEDGRTFKQIRLERDR